jgi:hypothetical protein
VLSVTTAGYTDYNDDNARVSAGERVEWTPAQRLPVPIDHRFTLTSGVAYYDFDRSLDHGYYDPDRYTSLYQMLGVDIAFGAHAGAGVSGRIAAERENSDDWFSAGSFSAELWWRAAAHLQLRAGYFNSRSRLDTRAGYETDGFWVGLEL